MDYEEQITAGEKKFIRTIALGVLGLIGLVIALKTFTIVPTGSVGVKLVWGQAQEQVLYDGWNWKNPFSDKVVLMDVQVGKAEATADAATVDLQSASTTVAVNFHVDPQNAVRLYKKVGLDYGDRIISPAIQESVKAATAKYRSDELIAKRESVRVEVADSLRAKLKEYDVVVDTVSVTNFQFSAAVNGAIEATAKAKQDALTAESKLKQVQAEADQKVATARAEAESIKLQSDAAQNDKYVELKRLEVSLEYAKRWDGKLPVNMYASTPLPFIDLNK